ncbi:WcaF family extracellular polysaccharide biosynthesis acetyltransferase [Cyanobium sp. Morenito 9A2]|uniref:WcaF family extracellular polysaccharide biosynthesis acetyltransferase n=1 Tax=Cyanobium sp. Morenito 9A2 TaxID=2823718 RepID=UPI0020CF6B7E|nr:WcaF family extracellular polysaccharide biosynthesis acetyltransferase [Cyanobium sp. Morenito 9A2]MCP9849801.1 WcaF family extracellular polysaccharide biosynthesis acetyltransferase [Cyanobium sp. Morenito 9A2]
MLQDLAAYRLPPDFTAGAPRVVQLVWFCVGSPLLAARWLPGSAWRVGLLRAFGARLGRQCRIKPGLRVKYPWRLVAGEACWLGEAVWIDNLAPVHLGDRVCLSQGAYLCTGNHDVRRPGFDLLLGPIELGDDAWIGARAVLAPGTRVGAGTVVALAAVASGDLGAGVIYAGHPARPSGHRWGPDQPSLKP